MQQPQQPEWIKKNEPMPWPLKNIWLGVSIEDQQAADNRIPLLLDAPAAVRWISCEPLLESINLIYSTNPGWLDRKQHQQHQQHHPEKPPLIDWVVIGGESGPHARPCNIDWLRQIVAACQTTAIPVFVKQLGSGRTEYGRGHIQPIGNGSGEQQGSFIYGDKKGGKIEEFPPDLQIRQFPNELLTLKNYTKHRMV